MLGAFTVTESELALISTCFLGLRFPVEPFSMNSLGRSLDYANEKPSFTRSISVGPRSALWGFLDTKCRLCVGLWLLLEEKNLAGRVTVFGGGLCVNRFRYLMFHKLQDVELTPFVDSTTMKVILH